MARATSTQKLTKLTLKLIQKDLKRIQTYKVEDSHGFKHDPEPGFFALTLSRYFAALMNHRRTTDKIEDEQRKALQKLTTKELKELAGVKE